ncbi:hypothetical protein AB5I41_25870 [Sphingomonas sp. MMS24-JH45]
MVDDAKRTTSLSFRLLPPDMVLAGGRCETSPIFRYTPVNLDQAAIDAAPRAAILDPDAPMAIVLDNPGGNHDPDVRETSNIVVTSNASPKLDRAS